MEALRFTAKNKNLEVAKIPIPKVTNPNEVLIKVAYAGICGTDLHVIQGKFPCNQEKTFTLGHEFCGTVVDVGPEATAFKKGDRVTVNPNPNCMCCHFCWSGNPHYCVSGGISGTIGIIKDGGIANYVLAPVTQVVRIVDTVTMEQASLTEPIACLAHGWKIISPITVGMKILVTGAGVIGSLWVCMLHLQGHRNVTVSEPNVARLNLLKKLNTGYELITPDQLKKNQASDPGYLFDLAIDCSGYAPAIEHAVTLLQRGGKLCCFGIAPPDAEFKIKPFDIYRKELKIYGVLTNPYSFPKSLGLIEAMGDRYLNFENLGIGTFRVNEYQSALEQLKAGSISKAIFKF